MRDTAERDRIREQYADRPGVGHHVERLMGELENAEAYGNEGAAERARAELAGHGHKTPAERSREEAAAARRGDAAARKDALDGGDDDDDGEKGARAQPPPGRTPPPRQTTQSKKPAGK